MLQNISRLLYVFLLIPGFWILGSCTDKNRSDTEGDAVKFMVLSQYIEYCLDPDGVSGISGGTIYTHCIKRRLNTGLIYNQDTDAYIQNPSISGNPDLECRGQNSQDYAFTAIWGEWYRPTNAVGSVPRTLELVFTHEAVTTDSNGRATSVTPFNSYSSGDELFCYNSYPYQIVRIE